MSRRLSIVRPDDWHLHLRDGEMLQSVIGATARHFARAIVMPNLVPPVVTANDALAYRARIEEAARAVGAGSAFEPLMTLYLTEQTEAQDVIHAASEGIIRAVKLYPAGATTNSASGVKTMERVMPVLEAMAEHAVKLCVHGEVTDPEVDIFDREARFIETVLDPLRRRVPDLQIVMEHVTTRQGVEYIASVENGLAGTITPHHLMINRNHLLVGGIRPHYYCLPIVKRESHRQALVESATGGDHRFFLGTDSAPHVRGTKESACGCAGVFNAPNTLSCLATVFEEADALDKLEAFVSLNGPRCYGLPINTGRLTLVKADEPIDAVADVVVGSDVVVAFDPGRDLYWYVESATETSEPESTRPTTTTS